MPLDSGEAAANWQEENPPLPGRAPGIAGEGRVGAAAPAPPSAVPERVAIIGLGPSCEAFVDHAKRLGARKKIADEVWAINALGDILRCDRVFHMDDIRVQLARAERRPDSNIAAMVEWLRTHKGPVYTSRPHPDFPGLVEYPLEAVVNSCCGMVYFNSTAAYAVAFAIHLGVREISLWGCDFTYPHAHDAEKGRACVEFYLGIAKARGIEIALPDNTALMDALAAEADRLYGYDTLDVAIDADPDQTGRLRVAVTPHDRPLDADDIERRYNHTSHPNPLVRG